MANVMGHAAKRSFEDRGSQAELGYQKNPDKAHVSGRSQPNEPIRPART